MKKLLSLIGALSIITGSAASLTACNTSFERFDKPSIQDMIKKTIMAEIEQGIAGQDHKLNYSFNQIFTSADLSNLAVKFLDTAIAKYFYNQEESKRQSWVTGTSITPPTDQTSLNKFIINIAKNNLYTEYMAGIASNQYLENTTTDKGYDLGYQTPNWYVNGIVGPYVTKIDGTLFTTSELEQKIEAFNNDATKYHINPVDNGAGIANNLGFFYKDETKTKPTSLQEKKDMLAARFDDYYLHYEVPNVVSNILTSAFIHNNEFQKLDDKGVNLNITNSLFNNLQTTWEINQGKSWDTNAKMIWEIKLSKNGNNGMTEFLNYLTNHFPTSANNKLSDPATDIIARVNEKLNPKDNAQDTGKNAYNAFKSVIDAFNEHSENSETGKDFNQISTGLDPVFEMDGFKGIAGISKGKTFTTNNFDSSYSDKIANNSSNTFGFLINKGNTGTNNDYLFNNDKNNPSLVFVLPIYAADLMNNMTMIYNTPGSQDQKSLPVTLKTKNAAGTEIDLEDVWKGQQTTLASPKEVAMLNQMKGAIGQPNSPTVVSYENNNYKSNILSLLENTFAQQTDIQNFAKQNFYSLAFNYNSKNVYSSELYNQIGKYIIDEN